MNRKSGMFLAVLTLSSLKFYSQNIGVTVSGIIKEKETKVVIQYANVVLKSTKDSAFIAGTVTDTKGQFVLENTKAGNYYLEISFAGYLTRQQPLFIGSLAPFLDLSAIELEPRSGELNEVTVTARQEAIANKMDKKTFTLSDNITQAGGSVLEAVKNLPGITVQDGKIQLRGNDRVMILIDGKQTALTGIGGQSGLDNIPASAIERIEIINNPSARYDANGNAGIVNIIFKKEKKEGLNGKVGFATGAGALWIKKENYPTIRPQYRFTPKINPSLSINYRKNKVNLFFQGDNLFTKTLNKNEFADRYYDDGTIIRQQTKRNRTTNIITGRAGLDWYKDNNNVITISGLFSSEKILDRGDEPFFNSALTDRKRLWKFLEDELKTTITGTAIWQHKFRSPGRLLTAGLNYTYHRENEKYFFTNIMPTYTGLDSFKLLSDEHVTDLTVDYVHPLSYGRFEGGIKFRKRYIPTNMQFKPGLNSPLDVNAGGWADYTETIPAAYGNYIFENRNFEIEAGLRVEYVDLQYKVNPTHPTYKSDGYKYTQPFPNLRMVYKIDNNNRVSLFYNRRVDRPNEVDIRIFPKYDDAEIIKVGNPALKPQFTNSFEAGYKTNWTNGYLYSALYHKRVNATISRIASIAPGSSFIYNVFQNAGHSNSTGTEIILSQKAGKQINLNLNLNGYQNKIDAFTVINRYPVLDTLMIEKDKMISGAIKFSGQFSLPQQVEAQLIMIYQAPDIIPQGKTYSRFSIDAGIKKIIQKGRGEIFLNVTDIANTLNVKKRVQGEGFMYTSTDYFETQVIRLGYSYKF